MTETYLHPSPEQIEALQNMQLDGPLVMLNLLRFRPGGEVEVRCRQGVQPVRPDFQPHAAIREMQVGMVVHRLRQLADAVDELQASLISPPSICASIRR